MADLHEPVLTTNGDMLSGSDSDPVFRDAPPLLPLVRFEDTNTVTVRVDGDKGMAEVHIARCLNDADLVQYTIAGAVC